MKPWFIRKLPSRVEILEGQNFAFLAHVGCGGLKPWFIKKLPPKIEILKGEKLDMRCKVGIPTEQQLLDLRAANTKEVVVRQGIYSGGQPG